MKPNVCKTPFNETQEQKRLLEAAIQKHFQKPEDLMRVLQQAQDIYGYLPFEVQTRIATGLNLSTEEVYGVVTFYSQFTLEPKGRYNFSVCLGTACYVKGSGVVLEKLKDVLQIGEGDRTEDGVFSIQATRCIGCCGLAPVMTVNEDVYGKISQDDVEAIVEKYRLLAHSKDEMFAKK